MKEFVAIYVLTFSRLFLGVLILSSVSCDRVIAQQYCAQCPCVGGAQCESYADPLDCSLMFIPGCTDDVTPACNFDPEATVNDGSCAYEECYPCPSDINQDNVVSVSDLLALLAAYGTVCMSPQICCNPCPEDINDDDVISTADLLVLLANKGTYCDHCINGFQDFDETGIDCGGADCPPCP